MTRQLKLYPLLIGLGLAVGAYFYCVGYLGLESPAAMTGAVTTLCAAWWCTEAIPIPVTALVPFAIFPLAGVLDHGKLASAYGDKFVLLFMAGFMLSRAAEKSQTHLRVAHGMMRLVGTDSNRRIIIGFMLATAFCSMWISNTATALIMLPVALAVIEEHQDAPKFAVSLLLAIAYGASIGGIATIVGTPPNGVFVSNYEQVAHKTVDFVTWMKIGVPVSVLMLIAAGVVLTLPVRGGGGGHVKDLGPWTTAQRRVLIVLATTAFLWITRTSPFGGWSKLLHMPMAQDATVGLAAVVMMFMIPAEPRRDGMARSYLLDWPTARDIPWGILILFGGGIAIAKAFQETGLATEIGQSLQVLSDMHPVVVIAVICFTVTFMTEVTSNTATTTLLMPILGATAIGVGVDPAAFMIPAALSASCAFMLPVATPPNAIVFGSDQITIPQMVRVGFKLNLIGVVIVTAVCYFMIDRQTGLSAGPKPSPPAVQQPAAP